MKIKNLSDVLKDVRYKDYFITSDGDIYSTKKIKENYGVKVNLSQNCKTKYLYFNFTIKNGKKRHVRHNIHRLVALSFVSNPNPNDYNIVNHIDEDRTNNNYKNLEWCNQRMNIKHSLNLHPDRVSPNRKLSEEDVLFILNNYNCHDPNFTGVALSKRFNVERGVIYNILHKKTYKTIDRPDFVQTYKHSNLTSDDVIYIRTNFKFGDSKFGYRPLSRLFGVDKNTIKQICNNITWKHLPLFEELNLNISSNKNTCNFSQEQTISSSK